MKDIDLAGCCLFLGIAAVLIFGVRSCTRSGDYRACLAAQKAGQHVECHQP